MKLLQATKNSGPLVTVERIGPEQATAMLECNLNNRNIAQRTVDLYASDMKAGNWLMTGEPIKFDIDGHLLDGQHRLWAVIQSGVTIEVIVIRDLRPDAQDAMDTGRKRTSSDALHLNGYKHATILAGSARLAINFDRGAFTRAGQQMIPPVSNAEVLQYVQQNPGLMDAVQWASSHRKNSPMLTRTAAVCLFILRRIDEDQADSFMADICEFRTGGMGDPRFVLLRRLQNAKENRENMSAIEQMHYVFRTWNAVRSGEDLKMLKAGQGQTAFQFSMPS